MKINLPNQLTLLRLALVPFFLIFNVMDNLYTRIFALIIFIVAALTDLYDGKLARKLGQVTVLGQFLDPLADKFLIAAAFISFVQLSEIHVSAWMVVLIIGREFLITGLRTLAVYKGRVLPAQPAGKFKTTSQITTIIFILVFLVINAILQTYGYEPGYFINQDGVIGGLAWFMKGGPYWMTFLTTVLTVVSGYIYIRANLDLFEEGKPV
ncbi:MAG: CDP-diacylglycerol--glycerol-3-phosphate 3-phosphatidyltransferase [Elusimicrobiota bacterium]